MTTKLPTVLQAKDQARRLRANMINEGTPIGHAKSLELVAHRHGFRDWNAMAALLEDGTNNQLTQGDKVTGTYLSQRFAGQVSDVEILRPGWIRVELHLDNPVDVVTSTGFSNLRSRIRGDIGPKGHTNKRTSDGQPHLQLDMS
ncbi:MAG: glyoxalase superfamily protein [Paracoccaceae bacterium]